MKIIEVCGAGPSTVFDWDRPFAHISFREPHAVYPPIQERQNRIAFLEIQIADFRHYAQAHEPNNEQYAHLIPTRITRTQGKSK